MPGSLLAEPYPTADQWKKIVEIFDSEAIAHKLLLAQIPFVFKDEPLKYALFRRIIGDAFNVPPTNVFIVGSAMAGRSLKGPKIHEEYSPSSDIDTLIISEHLYSNYVIESMKWLNSISKPDFDKNGPQTFNSLEEETVKHIGWFSHAACKGIWRPDSFPNETPVRKDFFHKFSKISLSTLGLQLSDDTVAKVNGRIARSFDEAVADLANSIFRLKKEFSDDCNTHGKTEQIPLQNNEPEEAKTE